MCVCMYERHKCSKTNWHQCKQARHRQCTWLLTRYTLHMHMIISFIYLLLCVYVFVLWLNFLLLPALISYFIGIIFSIIEYMRRESIHSAYTLDPGKNLLIFRFVKNVCSQKKRAKHIWLSCSSFINWVIDTVSIK